jgi:hypothetical protein
VADEPVVQRDEVATAGTEAGGDALYDVTVAVQNLEEIRAQLAYTDARLDGLIEEGRAWMPYLRLRSRSELDRRMSRHIDRWYRTAAAAYRRKRNEIAAAARTTLRKVSQAPTLPELPPERRLQMHYAFVRGGEGELEQARAVVEKVIEYNNAVKDLAGKAQQALGGLDGAKTVSQINAAAGRIDGYLAKIRNIGRIAEGLAAVAGVDQKSTSKTQGSIKRMQRGFAGIDAGLSFVKAVPIFGALWDNYYLPAATQALDQISAIAARKENYDRQYIVVKNQPWSASKPPTRLKGFEDLLPGGPPVLRFMFRVLANRRVDAPGEVKRYFVDHEELFEAGTGRNLKTDTSGWLWWKEKQLDDDLFGYVRRNRRTVWGMLYGDLPEPAGAT